MSHLSTAHELRQKCYDTGQCYEYQQFITDQKAQYSDYFVSDLIGVGIFLSIGVGMAVAMRLTVRNKGLREFMSKVLAISIILLPLLIIEAAAFIIGLFVSFSECYKQTCSSAENTAVIWVPALALLASLPLTWLLARRYKRFNNKLRDASKFWRLSSSVLLILVLTTSAYLTLINYLAYMRSVESLV